MKQKSKAPAGGLALCSMHAAASPAAMQARSSVPQPGCTAPRARLPPLPRRFPPFCRSTICDDPDMKYGPDLQQGGCKLCAVERCANCQVRVVRLGFQLPPAACLHALLSRLPLTLGQRAACGSTTCPLMWPWAPLPSLHCNCAVICNCVCHLPLKTGGLQELPLVPGRLLVECS